MKLNKFASLVLALALAASAMTACSDDTAETGDTKPELTETAEAPAETTITFASASVKAAVVRPEESAGEAELNGAQLIVQALNDKFGSRPTFSDDFVRKGEDPDTAMDGEILVGLTNRTASSEAFAKIGEHEFILAVSGGKLVVAGYTPELTKIAAEILVQNHLTDEGITLPDNFIEIYTAEPTYTYTTITNPVHDGGGDPWIVRDGDEYYYCYSGGNGVCVAQIDGLHAITQENGVKVYTAPGGTMYSAEYWAPELHKINGKWYIYVAADDGDNYNHRMYVLECLGDKPTDNFKMVGKITDSTDKWAIDGTVLPYNDELYFVWSGWEGDDNVALNLYIAHMSDPCTIDSERVMISKPDTKWERMGGRPWINEGPSALIKDDGVHIIYSGSGSWSDWYCLGRLTFTGGDILDSANWVKTEDTIFEKTDKVFGPGHASFTTAADGSTWIIYHANLVSGSGWGGRSIWTQPITWDVNVPVMGAPVDPGTELQVPSIGYSAEKVTKK